MPETKEVQRLMAIAARNAADALARPQTQRESHLAYCRAQWKRYATGVSRDQFERERFAAALDLATRDLMALLQEAPEAAATLRAEPRAETGPVEGAMESVIVHEAALAREEAERAERAEQAALEAAAAGSTPTGTSTGTSTGADQPAESGAGTLTAEADFRIEPWEERAAEVEDRQAARYSFDRDTIMGNKPRPTPQPEAVDPASGNVVPLRVDPDLQRMVKAVLKARLENQG